MKRFAAASLTAAALIAASLVPVSAAAAAPVNSVVSSVDAMFAEADAASPDPSATPETPAPSAAASAGDSTASPKAPTAAPTATAGATGKTRGDLRPPVAVRVTPNPVNQYAATTITVATTPPAAGVKVAFQWYGSTRASAWRTLATVTTNAAGVASYTFDPPTAGAMPIRAVNLASGIASRPVTLTVNPVFRPTAIAVGWPTGTPEVDRSYPVPVVVTPKGKIGVQLQRRLTGPTQPWTNLYAGGGSTNANGVASLLLNVPDSRASQFRVVTTGSGAIGSIPKAITASAFGTALYNVPLQRPSQPGQLIKAQELTTVNAGPGYPLTYPKSPLKAISLFGISSLQLGNAGPPDCTISDTPREDCTIGNQANPALQPAKQYRFMYTNKRMVPNDCPLVPGGSHGDCKVTAKAGTEGATALLFVPDNVQPGAKVVAWGHPTIGQENECSITRGIDRIGWTVPRSLDGPSPAAGSTELTMTGQMIGITGTGSGFPSTVSGPGIAAGTKVASVAGQKVTLDKPTTGEITGPLTFSASYVGGVDLNILDMEGFLDQMLAKGYIVVMPDYLGIAVNGPTSLQKTYMVGQQEARDLYYAAKAIRTPANPVMGWAGIPLPSNQFVTMGHSQGGSAAMWAGVEKKTLDPETGLNLVGVTAVAPAGDLNTITAFQWDQMEAWALAPELWQTYSNYLPALAAANNLLSPVGKAAQPALEKACTTEAASLAQDEPYLLNPAGPAFPAFLRWGYVFFGQTPVIEQGHVNSFPKNLPLNLVAGQADQVVLAQPLAALQQSFCNGGGQVSAYWTPVISGFLPALASGFGLPITGAADHLTVLAWPFGNNVGTTGSPTPELSAGSVLAFTEGRLSGAPFVRNCDQVQLQMPQQTFYQNGEGDSLPGTPASENSWYINTPLGVPAPFGLQDYLGSAGVPVPLAGNPGPAPASVDSSPQGCLMTWGDPDTYDVNDPNTPANPACTPFGLFPFGEYLYFTHNIGTGSWGIYPTNGTWHY